MATPLEEQLKRLPAKPGVYLFRDERGQVLYIGKAKSLGPRGRSYFQKTPASARRSSGSRTASPTWR
jgi:excinuclease ABC subunit C